MGLALSVSRNGRTEKLLCTKLVTRPSKGELQSLFSDFDLPRSHQWLPHLFQVQLKDKTKNAESRLEFPPPKASFAASASRPAAPHRRQVYNVGALQAYIQNPFEPKLWVEFVFVGRR
jgi:hypothetical protein